ncbi:hypothetical protein CTAYLR_006371 [Chrysophaeum taylorii]|uniref:Uncharacterized protein n=1 Tax=Chrysophaeum taylorii TaxID=2483200 RepID=A0AAD7XIB2_9STRA|nr:hypothetical protein CTAYLR_006371 [Chrysophaeum taylorii]
MLLTPVLFVSIAWAAAARPKWHELSNYTYASYVRDFSKTASAARREIFESRLGAIKAHNAGSSSSYKQGVNILTDLTESEIKAFKGLVRPGPNPAPPKIAATELPSAVDWRNSSVVTAVKDQGSCGSCWAFAATETLESAIALATSTLLTLAPQVFVDCAANPKDCGGTGGCSGATAEIAYATAMQYGVFNESQVPYEGDDETCDLASKQAVGNVTGYVRLPRNDYVALMTAVATIGPIAVSVDASWTGYEEGIFPASDGGTTIDHAVQLVGYGFDAASGLGYWLVRNSWGESWGEDGYIRLERQPDGGPCAVDYDNQDGVGCEDDPTDVTVCGTSAILYDSSYPTGAYLL